MTGVTGDGRDDPQFAEPWQARAFAIAVLLAERGILDWPQWSRRLGVEIGRAADSAGADYYEHWLQALEHILAERGIVDTDALAGRREAWRRAYLATPHGEPVELSAGNR